MPSPRRSTITNIRLVYLFGSAVTGQLRAGSDVDVGIRFATRPSLEELSITQSGSNGSPAVPWT